MELELTRNSLQSLILLENNLILKDRLLQIWLSYIYVVYLPVLVVHSNTIVMQSHWCLKKPFGISLDYLGFITITKNLVAPTI